MPRFSLANERRAANAAVCSISALLNVVRFRGDRAGGATHEPRSAWTALAIYWMDALGSASGGLLVLLLTSVVLATLLIVALARQQRHHHESGCESRSQADPRSSVA
jgi:hypothetical protein